VKKWKTCSKCGQELPATLEYFYSNKDNKSDGLRGDCKKCSIKRVKKYQSKHKRELNLKSTERKRNKKKRAVKLFGSICVVCGHSFPAYCFDFHHPNPSVKDVDPTFLFCRSWANIVKALKDTVLICANCHRMVHYGDVII